MCNVHFIEDETEVESTDLTSPRSHSWQGAALGFSSGGIGVLTALMVHWEKLSCEVIETFSLTVTNLKASLLMWPLLFLPFNGELFFFFS